MHALTHKARILALQPKLSASRIIGQKQMDGLRSNFEPLCFPKSCNSDDILLQLEFRRAYSARGAENTHPRISCPQIYIDIEVYQRLYRVAAMNLHTIHIWRLRIPLT